MASRDFWVSFRTWFQKFRGTVWFRATYLVLLGLIVAQLYLLTGTAVACLVLLLMPVTVFVVPFWLGERKMKRFALNAVVVFVIAIFLAAAMSTQALLSQTQAIEIHSLDIQQSRTMVLANGTVTPYKAPPSTPFTFRVRLITTANGTPDVYRVYLNLTVVKGFTGFERPSYQMTFVPGSGSFNNTQNGSLYEKVLSNLTDSIYGYGFSSSDRDKNWTFAGPDFGPITASGWTFYGFFVYVTALSGVMLLALITYFAILFLWWYMGRARAARTRMTSREPKIPKGRPKPADEPSGKASKAAAFTCTNCGADVSETDAKCPKCGAVFED